MSTKARELAELSRTIIDTSDATAITINANEEVTLADDLFLADAKKAIFGAGSDLQIYHDGNDSYIAESGAGDLIITSPVIRPRTDQFTLNNSANTEHLLTAAEGGSVALYYDAVKKLETDSSGVSISGVLTVIDGSTSAPSISNAGDSNSGIYFPADDELGLLVGGSRKVHITSSGVAFENGDLTVSGTLNGITTTRSVSGNRWGVLPEVASNGVLEIGRYLDFHTTDGDTSDYGARFDYDGSKMILTSAMQIEGAATLNNNATVAGVVTSGAHLINGSSSAFGGSSVQGFNTDFLVDTGQGYSRHNSYHTGGSNHQFLVNDTGSTTNAVALSIAKDKTARFYGSVQARRARSNTTGDVALSVQPSDSTIHYGFRIDSSTNSFNLDRADSGNEAQLLTVDPNGFVGINATPSHPLEVAINSGGQQDLLLLSNDNTATSNTAGILFAPSNGIAGARIEAEAIEDFSTSANRTAELAFQVRYNGTMAERWRINSVGVLVSQAQTPAGISGTPADANYTELGSGYLNLARDDTADADQILFGKNGVIHTKLKTINGAFVIDSASGNVHLTANSNSLNYNGTTLKPFDSDNNLIDLGTNGARYKDLYLSGNVKVASGQGIDFSATSDGTNVQNKSEVLDDYEEGAFTPSFYNDIGGTNYNIQNGSYVKIGGLITFNIYIQMSSWFSSSSALAIAGLPFAAGVSTSGQLNSYGGAYVSYVSNAEGSTEIRHGHIGSQGTTIALQNHTGGSSTAVTGAGHGSNFSIIVNGFYHNK